VEMLPWRWLFVLHCACVLCAYVMVLYVFDGGEGRSVMAGGVRHYALKHSQTNFPLTSNLISKCKKHLIRH
jgi:hypothetical protein